MPSLSHILGLTGQVAHQTMTAVQRLRMAALEHLRARIAEPLEPPRDWARAGAIGACAHCRELSHSWRIPTASVGLLRLLKQGAATWRSRSGGAAATWTW